MSSFIPTINLVREGAGLGGRNPFLGWAGVGVGGVCVAAAAALTLVAVAEAKKTKEEK